MTINPTTNVQIILITRFHFLIDLPRMLLSSKMTRIVLVVIRTKLKSQICHKSPAWAMKIKPSNNPIFAITLKHNSTTPQQDTFVSIVMQKSCQCTVFRKASILSGYSFNEFLVGLLRFQFFS